MPSISSQPLSLRSQRVSSGIAGALLFGGIGSFVFATSVATRAGSSAQVAGPLPALSSSPKPSPLVPMTREDAHRLARTARHLKVAADSSHLAPDAALAMVR